MDRLSSQENMQTRLWPKSHHWLFLLAFGVTLMVLTGYLDSRGAPADGRAQVSIARQMIGYANLLLIGSTILYVSHLWFTAKAVGRWASALATLGAIGCVIALSTHWIETYYLQRAGHLPADSMVEMMALFSAVTVVIYLVMERVYRTRSAGAFVMPIVVGAVIFEIWLDADNRVFTGTDLPVLTSYWMQAHILGNFIGYGSFAVAAAAGVMHLIRDHAEKHVRSRSFALKSLPEMFRIDRLMHQAILLGFPVFTLATVLGSLWAREVWGRYWAWDPKETWALLVWLTYASYFYFRYVNKWSGNRMAWWAIVGFGVTAFCFVGVSLLWPGLHAYGPRA
jgi:cytochrome c-type biogenesis protein CcsB